MIDDEKDVRELIEALNEHLPMRAYATPPLVKAVARNFAGHRGSHSTNSRVKLPAPSCGR